MGLLNFSLRQPGAPAAAQPAAAALPGPAFAATVLVPPPSPGLHALGPDLDLGLGLDLAGDEPTPSDLSDARTPGSAGLPAPAGAAGPQAGPPAQAQRLAEAEHRTRARPTLSQVGRYALKAPLGLGGLGQVHEAWDPVLSRTVAIKTLQFDLPPALRASLDGLVLNEARAAASLSHPYIVTVFDAGPSAQGVYIAMERLHGRDLRQVLARGWRPSPRVAAVLVRRVADALAYAHARGVVHCDIKPANIFLLGRDRPKVLDFGIARIAHAGVLPALEGSVAGSPHYQAPEQLRGEPVDGRTDVYALGTVLYELLTGRKAFPGNSLAAIQAAVLGQDPPPARLLRPGLPPGLAAIAARAMARDPAQRYPSAAELASALRGWVAASAGPPAPAARLAAAGQALRQWWEQLARSRASKGQPPP